MGYILVTVLGPLLSIILLVTRSSSSAKTGNLQRVFATGLAAYFESAIYFAIAIQIATLAITVPKDYETARISFGGYESRSCSLVSIICLLPLLYPLSVLSLLEDGGVGGRSEESSTSSATTTTTTTATTASTTATTTRTSLPISTNSQGGRIKRKASNKSDKIDNDTHRKGSYRLTLFSIAVLLSLYPFFSQSLHSWAPTQIGEGRGNQGATYVTEEEWAILEGVCFGGSGSALQEKEEGTERGRAERLTPRELVVIDVFHTVASCVVIIYTVGMLLPKCLRVLEAYYVADVRRREQEKQELEGADMDWLERDMRDENGQGIVTSYTTTRQESDQTTSEGSNCEKSLARVRDMMLFAEKIREWFADTRHRQSQQSTWMIGIVRGMLLLVPISLAVPLLWGFWRLRELQGQLAVANTGGQGEAGDWGFGQVMAITIFLPVGVEMVSVGVCSCRKEERL